MTWFLTYKGRRQSLEAWHIFNVTRQVLNQGTDTVTFQTDVTTLPFVCDETVEIDRDGVRWFWGRITQTPCYYSANKEIALYIVSGPSWYLEHLIFQQNWQYFNNDQNNATIAVPRSLCILGQDENGNPIDAKHCLQDIIAYAKTHGAPITCGNILGFDFVFPCETIKDCSCSEAILKLLRWTPDAIVWFDYTTQQPTIQFSRAAHLSAKTINLSDLSQFSLIPRNDLKMSSVVLKYEHSHSHAGKSWKTTTLDAYPSDTTGEELNALVLTLELEGTHSHTQEQWVRTEPIQIESIAWWKQHFPCLSDITDKHITIRNIKRKTNLPNELLEGAIAPWMGCKAAYETITADVSYKTHDTTIEHCIFSLKLCATNAISQIYRKTLYSNIGAEPPKNLAKILYDASNCLCYEGHLRFECKELSASFMGQVLSFSGGDLVWQTLRLPVQEERFLLDSGTVQLKFGAPKQLGPNDLCQLMHTHRIRTITEDTNARFAKKRAGGTKTYFPHMTPIVNSTTHSGRYTQLTMGDDTRQVVIDTRSLPPNTRITLKEYNIVENGQLKKIWLLSS